MLYLVAAMFVLLVAFCTITVLSACMLSSSISRDEEQRKIMLRSKAARVKSERGDQFRERAKIGRSPITAPRR